MKRRLVLLVLIIFSGWGDGRPGPHAHAHAGAKTRLVGPHSSSVFSQRRSSIQGFTAAWARPRSANHSPETVKLSEVRQLSVKVTLANLSKRPVTLDFPTTQRIEIYFMNSAGDVLTKWSENHAIAEKAATILIDPSERIEYRRNNLSPANLRPTKFLSPRFSSPISGAARSAKVPDSALNPRVDS